MALYCMGVTCSKPGGGTSQYLYGFFFELDLSADLLQDKFRSERFGERQRLQLAAVCSEAVCEKKTVKTKSDITSGRPKLYRNLKELSLKLSLLYCKLSVIPKRITCSYSIVFTIYN